MNTIELDCTIQEEIERFVYFEEFLRQNQKVCSNGVI